MALVINDRVRETTTVTGTSDAILLGAVTGFQAFSAIGSGNTTFYTISDQSGGNWEVGVGTYSPVGPTLARTTVLSSSNSGSKVSFPAGTKDVFVTYPSEKAVFLDASGNAQPALGNIVTSQVNITGQGDLRLEDSSGGEYVALQAPSSLTSSYTLTLPSDDGTSGQVLTTDGSGGLSWTTDAGGDVIGPASSTNNGVALFDGTTGKLLKNSSSFVQTTTGVGIGTTSPALKVDVVLSSSGDAIRVYNTLSSGYADVRIGNDSNSNLGFLRVGGSTQGGIYQDAFVMATAGGFPILFAPQNTERMRLDSSGNLMVGTTTVSAKLSVNNPVNGSSGIAAFQNSTKSTLLTIDGVGVTDEYLQGVTSGDSVVRTETGNIGIGVYDNTKSIVLGSSTTTRMLLATGGNVGIGTTVFNYSTSGRGLVELAGSSSALFALKVGTTPYAYFSASASAAELAAVGVSQPLLFTTNAAERMRIDSSGNVGIGINAPTRKLQVQGDVAIGTVGVSGSYAVTYFPDTSGSAVFWTKSDGYLAWGTGANPYSGGTERMRIDSSGNVGIGTSSPNAKLGVFGTGRIRPTTDVNLYIDTASGGIEQYVVNDAANTFGPLKLTSSYTVFAASGAERMRITTSGSVGIGTSSPSRTLDISAAGTSGTQVQVTGTTDSAGIKFVPASGSQYEIQANTASSWFVYDRTNSAFRLVVDSAGRVTTPYQPAFMSYAPSSPGNAGATFSFSPNTGFAATPVNIGSCFNATNGRFTAPVAGRYIFAYGTIAGRPPGQDIRTALAINGSPTTNGSYCSYDNVYVTLTQVMNLAAGDYVSSGLTTGAGSVNHCEFTGYLIG